MESQMMNVFAFDANYINWILRNNTTLDIDIELFAEMMKRK